VAETQDVYLSLGSNLGNREENLRRALAELKELPHSWVMKVSTVYETSPVGFASRHEFLNCCVQLRTELSSGEVLAACQRIEELVGRPAESERVDYEDRVLDIDLVLFGSEDLEGWLLTIPHPQATRRLFVLAPLAEIAPGIVINGKPVEHWVTKVRAAHPEQAVKRFSSLQEL